MFSIDIFNTFSTAIFVFIVICFVWTLLYSTHKIGSLYVGSLLKGILLVGIAICLYIIITAGANPTLLVISGVALIGFSIIRKPPEEWTNPPCQKPNCFSPAAPLSGSSWPSTLTLCFKWCKEFYLKLWNRHIDKEVWLLKNTSYHLHY